MSNETADNTTENGREWPDGEGPVRQQHLFAESKKDADALIVDVTGFEGPLDLLLDLARRQKVDLAKISVLALAEQYLDFINRARRMRMEIAADYLVMAAWLAYLKSRLLVPADEDDEDEMDAEELAAHLAFRLQRLQAMREAAAQLMARNRLGRDVFSRGAPEPVIVERLPEYTDNIVDLIKAYATRRTRTLAHDDYHIKALPVWTVQRARETLEKLIGRMDDWGRLDGYLLEYLTAPEERRTVIASTFSASLELAREGVVEIRQEKAFKPIYMRRAGPASAA